LGALQLERVLSLREGYWLSQQMAQSSLNIDRAFFKTLLAQPFSAAISVGEMKEFMIDLNSYFFYQQHAPGFPSEMI
jgi:hypothetical protein